MRYLFLIIILCRSMIGRAQDHQVAMASGGATISGGDLGYIYGQVIHNGQKETYLRIWNYTGRAWKILLQVIKLQR